jgi:hypothetical protein
MRSVANGSARSVVRQGAFPSPGREDMWGCITARGRNQEARARKNRCRVKNFFAVKILLFRRVSSIPQVFLKPDP